MRTKAMDYVIPPQDRALFKRCRRAWDLGARTRRNYEPTDDPRGIDVDRAVHDALAVYYFPGMWDWQPTIVLPLAREAFDRSIREQRKDSAPEREEDGLVEGARRLLESYFAWAPTVDRFAPIRVETDVDVQVPDPHAAGRDLVAPEGGAVRYRDRVDLLVIDEGGAYWAVDHRIVTGDWTDADQLLLDEGCLAWCWAWELSYPGMRIAGTIYNELRLDAAPTDHPPGPAPITARSPVSQHRRMYEPPTEAPHRPPGGPRLRQEATEAFRRTQIVRNDAELEEFGTRVALEALDMTDAELPLYPNPSPDNCARCEYRPPCIAMNERTDPDAILATSYRVRPPEPIEEGRLGGSTWSMGRGAAPPRFNRDDRDR
ncbi:MAG: hypothetical protein GEV03_14015 [Streptosporangiales bacterium]|nr:hypothetical protein [Streptosporangiales bacterium]